MTNAPICPKCGSQAVTIETRYGPRHMCCDLWSYKGRPLVDKTTHRARIKAHDAFDKLWKGGPLRRSEAYKLLAIELNIPGEECHMSSMGLDLLRRVPDATTQIRVKVSRTPIDPMRLKRQRLSEMLPKCHCGNTLSRKRIAEGIEECPACEQVGAFGELS